eukprot:ctg_16.g3
MAAASAARAGAAVRREGQLLGDGRDRALRAVHRNSLRPSGRARQCGGRSAGECGRSVSDGGLERGAHPVQPRAGRLFTAAARAPHRLQLRHRRVRATICCHPVRDRLQCTVRRARRPRRRRGRRHGLSRGGRPHPHPVVCHRRWRGALQRRTRLRAAAYSTAGAAVRPAVPAGAPGLLSPAGAGVGAAAAACVPRAGGQAGHDHDGAGRRGVVVWTDAETRPGAVPRHRQCATGCRADGAARPRGVLPVRLDGLPARFDADPGRGAWHDGGRGRLPGGDGATEGAVGGCAPRQNGQRRPTGAGRRAACGTGATRRAAHRRFVQIRVVRESGRESVRRVHRRARLGGASGRRWRGARGRRPGSHPVLRRVRRAGGRPRPPRRPLSGAAGAGVRWVRVAHRHRQFGGGRCNQRAGRLRLPRTGGAQPHCHAPAQLGAAAGAGRRVRPEGIAGRRAETTVRFLVHPRAHHRGGAAGGGGVSTTGGTRSAGVHRGDQLAAGALGAWAAGGVRRDVSRSGAGGVGGRAGGALTGAATG